MRIIVIVSVIAATVAEAVLVSAGRPDLAGYLGAAVVAAALVAMLVTALPDDDDAASEPDPDEFAVQAAQFAAATTLAEWRNKAELTVEWASGSSTDWDRHVRPMLSREFAAATGKSPDRDYADWSELGVDVFGEQLWQWVDSRRIPPAQPAPGPAALSDICARLEQL